MNTSGQHCSLLILWERFLDQKSSASPRTNSYGYHLTTTLSYVNVTTMRIVTTRKFNTNIWQNLSHTTYFPSTLPKNETLDQHVHDETRNTDDDIIEQSTSEKPIPAPIAAQELSSKLAQEMVSQSVLMSSSESKNETTDDVIQEHQPSEVFMDGHQPMPQR